MVELDIKTEGQMQQVDEECFIENKEENLQKSQQNKNRNPGGNVQVLHILCKVSGDVFITFGAYQKINKLSS